MFWGLVRVAGIIIGVATLLRLATTEGLVTYDAVFQAWMDRLQGFVELGFLTDLIEPSLKLVIEWARSFGVALPDLQPEWRPAFILTGLLLGAYARHSTTVVTAVLLGTSVLVAAAVAGLTGGVAHGFLAAFAAAASVWRGWHDRAGAFVRALVFIIGAGAALAVIAGVPSATAAFVAAIAAYIAALAAASLVGGIAESRREKTPVLTNPNFNIGLDILGAMGLALGLAVMFADPPLF